MDMRGEPRAESESDEAKEASCTRLKGAADGSRSEERKERTTRGIIISPLRERVTLHCTWRAAYCRGTRLGTLFGWLLHL